MNQRTPITDIREENRIWLEQLAELLGRVTPEDYTAAESVYQRGSAGKHVRHVLEHYDSLLSQVPGEVNYDIRRRDPRIEQNPRAAAEWSRSLSKRLSEPMAEEAAHEETVGSENAPLKLRHRADEGGYVVDSSLARELMFLSSHTVHHFALIRFILESRGVEVPDEFGVAPSTLRFEQRQQA